MKFFGNEMNSSVSDILEHLNLCTPLVKAMFAKITMPIVFNIILFVIILYI